jgi:RNA polymerase sigma-70 factor (ECF subfamily)
MVYGLCLAADPEPDDAYQEVWEKALRALPRFDPAGPATFSTWLYEVAHHQLIDRSRRRKARPTEARADDPRVEAGQDEVVARGQATDRLRHALAALPDPMRRAVVFHYLEELPVDQIAAREGVPVGTVKSRLHHGRGRLLELLGRRP